MTRPIEPEHCNFFFIQLADPQFGLFAALSGADDAFIETMRKRRLLIEKAPKTTGFANETKLYRKAINAVNRLKPEFVVVCGDMINDSDDILQFNELMSITDELNENIPIWWVPGNHDVGNNLTYQSLATYRSRFGKDNYAFNHKGSRFLVLNSNVAFDPSKVPEEWDRQLSFLESALENPVPGGGPTVVFTHHPLFLNDRYDSDSFLIIPTERRLVLFEMLKKHAVWGMFSGHWHRNNYANDENFQVVTSAAVGYPLGDDPSGLRIVKVYSNRIEHQYYGFDDIPETVNL